MDPRVFDLPAARLFWRRLEGYGIAISSLGASLFLVGAVLVLANSRQTWDFRVQVALLFVGGAAFILALVWTPLRPSWRTRRAPIRLGIDDEGVMLEVSGGPPTRVAWDDSSFQLSLWTWPPGRSNRPRFSLDLGGYSSVPIEAAPTEAIREAVRMHHLSEEATTFRLPFGQKGTAVRITYRRRVGGPITGTLR